MGRRSTRHVARAGAQGKGQGAGAPPRAVGRATDRPLIPQGRFRGTGGADGGVGMRQPFAAILPRGGIGMRRRTGHIAGLAGACGAGAARGRERCVRRPAGPGRNGRISPGPEAASGAARHWPGADRPAALAGRGSLRLDHSPGGSRHAEHPPPPRPRRVDLRDRVPGPARDVAAGGRGGAAADGGPRDAARAAGGGGGLGGLAGPHASRSLRLARMLQPSLFAR